MQRKEFFQRHVAHVVGQYARDLAFHVVVRGSETLAVIAPLVNETPRSVRQSACRRSGVFGDIDQLFADRLVGPVHWVTVVDRGCPRKRDVCAQLPVLREPHRRIGFQFDAVRVYLLDVLRRPETLERRQPHDPVVDIRVEPRRRTVERIFFPFFLA